jgi:hypothetical protein
MLKRVKILAQIFAESGYGRAITKLGTIDASFRVFHTTLFCSAPKSIFVARLNSQKVEAILIERKARYLDFSSLLDIFSFD